MRRLNNKMIKVVKEVTLLFRFIICRALSVLLNFGLSKSSSYVVFGAMNSQFAGDNTLPMYLDWLERGLKGYWFTSNYEEYEVFKSQGRPVLLKSRLKDVIISSRASCYVISNSLFDVAFEPGLVNSKARLINMRHGRSAKKVRFARESHKITFREKLYRNHESNLTFAVASTSPFVSKIQEECLRLGDKHRVVGYPRNDQIVKCKSYRSESDIFKVLYAPTWRHGRNATQFFPFSDFDVQKLNDFLNSHNIEIHLRPHRGELMILKAQLGHLADVENSSIKIMTHNELPDVNSQLFKYDALISDYSAIIHDYLLLDRPIIIVPYDYMDFKGNNGFLFDPIDYAPGKVVYNNADFIKALYDSKSNRNAHENKRMALRDLIFSHIDDRSTQRANDLVEEAING